MKSLNGNNHRNHINSNYMAIVEQKTNSSQSASDCRTPIAWHNRSINLSKPIPLVQSPQTLTNYTPKYRRSSGQRSSQRPSSPSATTTSSDDREEVPMVRHHMRRPNSRMMTNSALTVDRRHHMNHMNNHKFGNHFVISGEYSVPIHALRSGTLRSTKSVPALAMSSMMDGDPCPVHGSGHHHHGNGLHASGLLMQAYHPYYPPIPAQTLNFRRFGSIGDMRETRIPMTGNGLPFLAPIPENKQTELMSVYYSPHQTHISGGHPTLPALPPPNSIPLHLMPSKVPSRTMIYPAYAEPLPFRNHPFKVSSPVPSQQTVKIGNNYGTISDDLCCRGHLIVLWIILGVVTVGVIAGIILAVTMN